MHDLTEKKVNYNAGIIPFSINSQISDVTHLNKIRVILSKVLPKTAGIKTVNGKRYLLRFYPWIIHHGSKSRMEFRFS